jgi:hypothetical protein
MRSNVWLTTGSARMIDGHAAKIMQVARQPGTGVCGSPVPESEVKIRLRISESQTAIPRERACEEFGLSIAAARSFSPQRGEKVGMRGAGHES